MTYTAEEVRNTINTMRVANPDELRVERMLTAYADLLEQAAGVTDEVVRRFIEAYMADVGPGPLPNFDAIKSALLTVWPVAAEPACKACWAPWPNYASDPNSHACTAEPVAQVDDQKILWGLAANAGRVSIFRRPRWAHVSDATGQGSTSSAALCRRFGFDPDEITGDQLQPDPDDAPTVDPVAQPRAVPDGMALLRYAVEWNWLDEDQVRELTLYAHLQGAGNEH